MYIVDNAGSWKKITNLDEAIVQADGFRSIKALNPEMADYFQELNLYWQDVYDKLLRLKKKRRFPPYFLRSYELAQRNYRVVAEATKDDRNRAGFLRGGHIRKGYLNRIKGLNDKVHRLSMKAGLRNIFLNITRITTFNGEDSFHAQIHHILNQCNLHKYPIDDFDYLAASFPGTPYAKQVAAVRRFVETYGNKFDKKYLLPILE